MSRSRNYCFTLNNYTDEELENIKNVDCKFIVIGFEIGKNKTPHLQGYIEFKNAVRFETLKNKLGDRCHIEVRKGTAVQACNYCKKDGKFLEIGQMSAQGSRTDLDTARTLAVTDGMRTVSAYCSYAQIKTAEKFLTYNEEPRDFKPHVEWIHGPTGIGKSKSAREKCPEDCYVKNDGTKWWDGYDGHENVIIDDFRDSWWSLTEMLSLLDRYEKRVEFKGGYRQFKPKVIIVTSAKHPRECYLNCGESIDQLLRRIDLISELDTDVTEVGGNTIPQLPTFIKEGKKEILDELTDI